MATTTLTTNLKLRISSDLTADSRYNLQRLDSLGSIYQIDTTETAKVRSQTNIILQPNDPDIGGSGSGGTVQFGTADQPLATLQIYSSSIVSNGPLSTMDQATGGTNNLNLQYKSDVNGAVDTTADRTLSFDLEGGDRNIVLGGNLSIPDGDLTVSGASLSLTLGTAISWTLPSGNGTSGQFLQTDGAGTLTWASTSSFPIGDLSDVTVTSPSDGQILVYSSGTWVNQSTGATAGAEDAFTWTSGDGTTRTITHNYGSRQVMAEVLDVNDDYKTVEVDSVTRPTDNTIVLTASSAPSNWLVLIKEIN